jgi:hypothetical protein
MRVLVTGAAGKPYVTADLCDAGRVFSLVGGFLLAKRRWHPAYLPMDVADHLDPGGTHRGRPASAEGWA